MNKLFWILVLARWLSELGDWFNYMVLLTIIDDYKYISIMVAIRNIVPFVISPIVGNFVETHNNITIIVVVQTILLLLNGLLYFAFAYPDYWYASYGYVFVQSICICIKSSSYQYIVPLIIQSEMIEKGNKIQALSQASVYVVGVGAGGVILSLAGDVSNLIIDSTVYISSILTVMYFRRLYTIQTDSAVLAITEKAEQVEQVEQNTDIEPVSFKTGILYLVSHQQIAIIMTINAMLYYTFGIAEIINLKIGFEKYGILILSLVLGLSTTGTIILYFDRADRYLLNYVFLLVAMLGYGVTEVILFVPVWFFGLWLFTYVHYAFQIMMATMIQKDDPNYKGRLFTYYYGFTSVMYALGSFTGSFVTWYWIMIGVSVFVIGLLVVRYAFIDGAYCIGDGYEDVDGESRITVFDV